MSEDQKNKIFGYIQLGVVAAFVLGAFVISALLNMKSDSIEESVKAERVLYVETQTVSPAPYRIHFTTTGTVGVRGEVNIVPEVSGRIIEVNDNFFGGGTFKKDELLFRIDPRDFELAVKQLKAQVAQASTNLDLAKAESKAALSEWKQLNGSRRAPDLVARKPQLQEAEAALESAKAQLENAQLDLERSSFRLPFDGRVLSTSLETGQYVMAGQSYGSVFNIEALEVTASLKDSQLEWLLTGEKADVQIDATYMGKSFSYEGYLKRGPASLDAQTRFATVTFGFEDKPKTILPGVFVTLKIEGPQLPDIVQVPVEALQSEVIWSLKDDNTITAIEPNIVFRTNDYLVVDNISGTNKIVTSRISGAVEGMKVKTSDDLSRDTEGDSPPEHIGNGL